MSDRLATRVNGRAGGVELWVLSGQRASGLPPMAFGVVCGAVVFFIVALPAWLAPGDASDAIASASFFGVSVAVLAGFTPHIFPGAVNDFRQLRPALDVSDTESDAIVRSLTRMEPKMLLAMSAIGLGIGVGHAWVLGLFQLGGWPAASQVFGTVSLWIAMFWTVPPLLANAEIFAALGERARPDLLRPAVLAPFGATAIRPTLFIIGMLCAYPLLMIPADDFFLGPALIGFTASFASMFGLFFLPLRGIRRRIRREKVTALAELDARIDAMGRPSFDELGKIRDLETLLALRQRIAHASSWPLDLAGVQRVLIYIVLPPMTWAAAALVEMLIDQQF